MLFSSPWFELLVTVVVVSVCVGCFRLCGMFPLGWDVSVCVGCFRLCGMFPFVWDVSAWVGCFRLGVIKLAFCTALPAVLCYGFALYGTFISSSGSSSSYLFIYFIMEIVPSLSSERNELISSLPISGPVW